MDLRCANCAGTAICLYLEVKETRATQVNGCMRILNLSSLWSLELLLVIISKQRICRL